MGKGILTPLGEIYIYIDNVRSDYEVEPYNCNVLSVLEKPLPVTVTAQTIAKMVTRAKTMLTTLRIVFFFIQSHSFVNFLFSQTQYPFIMI